MYVGMYECVITCKSPKAITCLQIFCSHTPAWGTTGVPFCSASCGSSDANSSGQPGRHNISCRGNERGKGRHVRMCYTTVFDWFCMHTHTHTYTKISTCVCVCGTHESTAKKCYEIKQFVFILYSTIKLIHTNVRELYVQRHIHTHMHMYLVRTYVCIHVCMYGDEGTVMRCRQRRARQKQNKAGKQSIDM